MSIFGVAVLEAALDKMTKRAEAAETELAEERETYVTIRREIGKWKKSAEEWRALHDTQRKRAITAESQLAEVQDAHSTAQRNADEWRALCNGQRQRAEAAEAALAGCEQARVAALDGERWVAQKKQWDVEVAQSEAQIRTVAHEMLMVQLAESNLERDTAIARAEAAEAKLATAICPHCGQPVKAAPNEAAR